MVLVKDLESIGFSSDVGFWFFFGLSSFDLGLVLLRTNGSESLIDHTYSTTQTYNPPGVSARGVMLNFQAAVFTVIFVELLIRCRDCPLFLWTHHNLAYFVVLKPHIFIQLSISFIPFYYP